jgi:hypothetical protein
MNCKACDELQSFLNAKVFECKSFDAKAMYAEIAATLILLLRRPFRKNALLSDYLIMDVQAYSGDSPIHDL